MWSLIDYKSISENEHLKRSLLSISVWLRKNRHQECLATNVNCSGPVINAHTVQNRCALESLAIEGHVYMFNKRDDELWRLKLTGKIWLRLSLVSVIIMILRYSKR